MTTNPSQARLQWIDQIKGVAIAAIVCFHFFQNYPEQVGLVTALNRNGAKLGYAGVDIFFVMAGFNISFVMASRTTQVDWLPWLKKRLSRLYPTYLLAVACSLLLYVCFRDYRIHLDLKFVLSCLGLAGTLFQSINPGFWFFTVILQAYLVTPLIFKVCKDQPERFLFLGVALGILDKVVCAASRGSILFPLLYQINFLGSYIFQFCLGLYWGFIYAKNRSFRTVDWIGSLALFTAGLAVYIALEFKGIDIIYMLGFDLVFTPLMFIGLYQVLTLLPQLKPFQSALSLSAIGGIYSYQIYLIHQPLMFTVFPYLSRLLSFTPAIKIPLFFIVFIGLLTIYVYLFIALETFLRKRIQTVISKKIETAN